MTDPQQSDTEPATPARRPRRPPAWLVGACVALAAIVVLFLLRDRQGEAAAPRDLSTPRGAAEAFAMAASAGDVDGVLAATCLGDAGCAAEHGGGVSAQQITAAKEVMSDNLGAIGDRLRHAEFTTARAGAQRGTQEVDYRLPGVSGDERNYLVFVHYRDRWLYIATGGPTSPAPAPAPAPAT